MADAHGHDLAVPPAAEVAQVVYDGEVVDEAAAAAAGVAAAGLAAPAAGQFDVTYHDMNAALNPETVTHV
jgi:hypothetical protein